MPPPPSAPPQINAAASLHGWVYAALSGYGCSVLLKLPSVASTSAVGATGTLVGAVTTWVCAVWVSAGGWVLAGDSGVAAAIGALVGAGAEQAASKRATPASQTRRGLNLRPRLRRRLPRCRDRRSRLF